MRAAAGQRAEGCRLRRLARRRLRRQAGEHRTAQRRVGRGKFGGALLNRRLELRRAVAFDQLLAPREAALALGTAQRECRADRDDRRGRAEQGEEQDRLVETGAVGGRQSVALAQQGALVGDAFGRSEKHTSELQSTMRNSYV